MQAQQSAVAQQMAHLESYSASSEQLFGTATHPHPVTGADPNDAPEAEPPGEAPRSVVNSAAAPLESRQRGVASSSCLCVCMPPLTNEGNRTCVRYLTASTDTLNCTPVVPARVVIPCCHAVLGR